MYISLTHSLNLFVLVVNGICGTVEQRVSVSGDSFLTNYEEEWGNV